LTFYLYLTEAPKATCARATPSLEKKKKETKREEKKKGRFRERKKDRDSVVDLYRYKSCQRQNGCRVPKIENLV